MPLEITVPQKLWNLPFGTTPEIQYPCSTFTFGTSLSKFKQWRDLGKETQIKEELDLKQIEKKCK